MHSRKHSKARKTPTCLQCSNCGAPEGKLHKPSFPAGRCTRRAEAFNAPLGDGHVGSDLAGRLARGHAIALRQQLATVV